MNYMTEPNPLLMTRGATPDPQHKGQGTHIPCLCNSSNSHSQDVQSTAATVGMKTTQQTLQVVLNSSKAGGTMQHRETVYIQTLQQSTNDSA